MTRSPESVLDALRMLSPYETSIALGLVACLIVAGSVCAVLYDAGRYHTGNPEIVYVAADATTGDLAFKVHNAGDGNLYICAF
jgi:hypothetical protein